MGEIWEAMEGAQGMQQMRRRLDAARVETKATEAP